MKLKLFIFTVLILNLSSQGQQEEETTTDIPNYGDNDQSETIDVSNAPADYSRLGLQATYPNGGVLIQYTQTGLDYVIKMVEGAVVKLLHNFRIPDTEQDGFSLKSVKVNHFEELKLLARFINQTGIEIKCVIPKLEISGKYSGAVGWFSSTGTIRINVMNLIVSMLIRIEKGNLGFPSFKIPMCFGKIEKFRVVFSDHGWSGTILNGLRGFVESIITTSLGNIICFAARNATDLIETVFLDLDGPRVLDPKIMCGNDINKLKRGGGGGVASAVLAEMEGLSIDFNLDGNAYFEDNEIVAGLRGDFLFKGKYTDLEPRYLILPPTQRMICFAVKEIVPNSFGIIGHEQKYFELRKKLQVSDLPSEVRTPTRLLCGSCKLQLYAVSKDPPKIKFTPSGVRAWISTFVQIDGRGFFNTKINVVQATAEIETLTNLYIKENTVKGSVNLGNINVKILDVGFGGLFDNSLNALLRRIIPKTIWPIARDRINKAIDEKGFKLPALCGLSFNNTEIQYVEGAVIVRTDFIFDLNGFINRLMSRQQEQSTLTSTVFDSEEEEY